MEHHTAKVRQVLERNASTNSCKALFQRKNLFLNGKSTNFRKNCHEYFRENIMYGTFLFSQFSFKSFTLFRHFSYTVRFSCLKFVDKNKVLFCLCEGASIIHIFRKNFRFNPRIRVFRWVMDIYRTVRMYHVKKSYCYVYFSVEVLRRIKKINEKSPFCNLI
jgi:hypothetical protein